MGIRRALIFVPGPGGAYMGETCKMSLVFEIGFHITQARLASNSVWS